IRQTPDGGHPAGLPTVGRGRSQQQPKEIAMNRIRHIRRLAAALTGLAGALLAFAGAVSAARAWRLPPHPPGWNKHPPVSHVHAVVIGGMPGWQITLIAIAAALLAATVAVLATARGPRTARRSRRALDPCSQANAVPLRRASPARRHRFY